MNEEVNGIMKIFKSLEESGFLIKDISKAIKNEVKEQKGGFLSMLLGTLGASLLGNLLTGKGTIRVGEGTIEAGQDFFMPPHLFINFEIQKYYQNEPKFNGVYLRNNLPKIKDGIALCVNDNNIIYFDTFEVEHIPKEIKKFIGDKNIITNIYRTDLLPTIR